jgi:hypothetical protein
MTPAALEGVVVALTAAMSLTLFAVVGRRLLGATRPGSTFRRL